jgi:hypothetical protein
MPVRSHCDIASVRRGHAAPIPTRLLCTLRNVSCRRPQSVGPLQFTVNCPVVTGPAALNVLLSAPLLHAEVKMEIKCVVPGQDIL